MTDNKEFKTFDTFSFEIQNEIAIFTFKGKALFNAAGLFDMDHLAKAFKDCADDKKLKVIVIKRDAEKKDSKEYYEFVKQASQAKDKIYVAKMLNYYNRFIMEVYSQKKFVISVDSGNVVAQFLNLSLACDYRIISDDTVIQKEYFRNGLVPKGGATFFLTQIVGKSKAYKILFSEKDISAQEALDLGLVDEIAPSSKLEEATMKRALEFAKVPRYTISGIKSLMNYSSTELEKYLSYENDVIVRIFEKMDVNS
ncbi:MAG TPA: enoyl-CoA hydratase/isomerase family protein [bacterium]|nr:enoyl-CoA hydratase/isomerase family protein [bacterium]